MLVTPSQAKHIQKKVDADGKQRIAISATTTQSVESHAGVHFLPTAALPILPSLRLLMLAALCTLHSTFVLSIASRQGPQLVHVILKLT